MGTRSRPIPCPLPSGQLTATISWPLVPGSSSTSHYGHDWSGESAFLMGKQVTVSESHPAWRHRLNDGFKDIGGPFFTERRYAEVVPTLAGMKGVRHYDDGSVSGASYTGPLLPCSPHLMQWPKPNTPSKDSMLEAGATAIARCAPSNSVADLSTFLGETVKDGLPSLIGSTLRGLKSMSPTERRKALGKEHLNVEFGWKPFVNDLKKLSSGIVNADAVWRQYERDSGKLVRRRYVFPEYSSFESRNMGTLGPYYAPSHSTLGLKEAEYPHGYVLETTKVTRRQWFSGGFTYYIPDEDRETVAYNVIQAKKLLGLSLTPDVVWNIMPWSWALDWFGNTGDVIQNWSNWAIDGQVLRYGYLMTHTVSKNTYTWHGPTQLQGKPTVAAVSLVIETKQRIKAGPYGFGSSFEGLTPRQAGIVTALGMTKGK